MSARLAAALHPGEGDRNDLRRRAAPPSTGRDARRSRRGLPSASTSGTGSRRRRGPARLRAARWPGAPARPAGRRRTVRASASGPRACPRSGARRPTGPACPRRPRRPASVFPSLKAAVSGGPITSSSRSSWRVATSCTRTASRRGVPSALTAPCDRRAFASSSATMPGSAARAASTKEEGSSSVPISSRRGRDDIEGKHQLVRNAPRVEPRFSPARRRAAGSDPSPWTRTAKERRRE